MGLAGISWVLLELGLRPEAEAALRVCSCQSSLTESADLFHGIAGWGMAQLRFFIETRDSEYLAQADKAGQFLVKNRKSDEDTCWWPVDDVEACGLGHGTSGVSLFLLYLCCFGDLLRGGSCSVYSAEQFVVSVVGAQPLTSRSCETLR